MTAHDLYLTLRAIDKSFQHDRPIANARKRAGRDRQVILDKLEFCKLRLK
jgi:hypothetical protein